MSDNLTRLQYAVEKLSTTILNGGYAFTVEASILPDGGLVISTFNVFEPNFRFPLAWVYSFSQDEFDKMLDEVAQLFKEPDFDLEEIVRRQGEALNNFLENKKKNDPELAQKLEEYEAERAAFLGDVV